MIIFQVRPYIKWQEGTISTLFIFKHYPSSHSNVMINTMTKKKLGEERVSFIYMSQSQFITGENQGRNGQLEAGPEAEATEESCLPAYSPWLA